MAEITKVYVLSLWARYDYDCTTSGILGVFTSQEKAEFLKQDIADNFEDFKENYGSNENRWGRRFFFTSLIDDYWDTIQGLQIEEFDLDEFNNLNKE